MVSEISRQQRMMNEKAQIVYALTYLAVDSIRDRLNNKKNEVGRRELQEDRAKEAIKNIMDFDIIYIPKEFLKSFRQVRNNWPIS